MTTSLFKKTVRTTQPQGASSIDWGNPIARGLAGAYIPAIGASAAGLVATRVGTSIIAGGLGGLALVNPSGVHGARVPLPASAGLGTTSPGATLLVVFSTRTSATSAFLGGLGSDSGSVGNTLFAIGTGSTSASAVRFTAGGSNNNIGINSANLSVNDGRVHVAVLTLASWSSATAEVRGWLDGQLVASTTMGGAAAGTANLYSWLCAASLRRTTDLGNGGDSDTYLLGAWARVLSDAEIASISANPWQLFAKEAPFDTIRFNHLAPSIKYINHAPVKTCQPTVPTGVNTASPLCDKLVAALVAIPGISTGFDLVNGKRGQHHYNASAHSVRLGANGGYFYQSTIYDDLGAQLAYNASTIRTGASVIEISSDFPPLSDTDVWHFYVQGATGEDGVVIKVDTSNIPILEYRTAYAGTVQVLSATESLSVGKHVLAWTYYDGTLFLYVDGVLVSSVTTGIHWGPNVPANVGPRKYASPTHNSTIRVNACFAWIRPLTPAELRALSDNPWQISYSGTLADRLNYNYVTSNVKYYVNYKKTRTSQPQTAADIDWNNPISRGLVGAWPSGSGPLLRDAVAGRDLTLGFPGISGGAFFRSSNLGMTLDLEAGNRNVTGRSTAPALKLPGGTALTIAVWLNPGAASPTNCGLIGAWDGSGFMLYANPDLRLYVNGTYIAAGGAPLGTANKWVHVAATWSAATGRGRIYVNGALTLDAALAQSSVTASGAQFELGNYNTGGGTAFNGRVVAPAVWGRALSDAEIASISANPWQLFKGTTLRYPAPVVSEVMVYLPGSDIVTTGWSAIPGPEFYAAINESGTPDTDNYIISPEAAAPDPITLGWAQSVPAGTWEARINLRQETLSGSQVRMVLLDASNNIVGTSSWIDATGSYTTHNVTFTTTDTSTKFRLEVQQGV